MTWLQQYTPVAGSVGWSALLATVPILYFFWALAVKRMKGHVAALTTVAIAILDSVLVFHFPIKNAISSTIYGMLTGLWPIGWIVFTAVFLYNLTVKSGFFDTIRESISGITDDRRIQMLLIAFCFGAFLEGAAGFGAPVAIAGAMLVGLGFNPIYAAGLCLIADTAPVAYGALGIPITAMASLTHSNPLFLSQVIGRQLPLISLFLPFWMIIVMNGVKGVKQVWPAALTAGLSFSLTQFLVSNFIGPQLTDVLSALVSLVSLVILMRVWKPKTIFRFDHEMQTAATLEVTKTPLKTNSSNKILRAWSPFILLTLMIILWTIPSFKAILSHYTIKFNFAGLHNEVLKGVPIVAKPTPIPAVYTFDILSATGTAILITAFITKFITKLSFGVWLKILGETLVQLRYPLLTIATVVGFGQLMNYSGMSASMALALASTGVLFPIFSPLLGWIGVFLTGSDTSSNLLFGNLQQLTAQQLHLNPYLTMGANSSGGVMGKMISPQSIAVGTSATGLIGREGDLYRFTIKHSLFFLSIIAAMTMLQAYVFPGMIPGN